MTSSTTFTCCIPEDTSPEEVDPINHVVTDVRKRVQHQNYERLQPKRKYKTWQPVFQVKYFVSLNRYQFYYTKVRYE
jgi:hypothetical protein